MEDEGTAETVGTPMATESCETLAGRKQPVVLYDGQCALCRQSVALLRRLDWLGRLTCRDARDPANLPPAAPLVPARLLEEMHLVAGERVYHGFAALRWLAWRLPLLWPIAPFLYLPGVPQLGQRLYLWIARNRFQLVPCHGGVCTISNGSSLPLAGDSRGDATSGRQTSPSPPTRSHKGKGVNGSYHNG
jgi:predicted DCC family thiol-disulfide oxidoreductase YuxK